VQPDPIVWINQQSIEGIHFYYFTSNNPINTIDAYGLYGSNIHGRYSGEDKGWTQPNNPFSTWRHFRDLDDVLPELNLSVYDCNENNFLSRMHQMQDYFSHYGAGYRWWSGGHIFASISAFLCGGPSPDDPASNPAAFRQMQKYTMLYESTWQQLCGPLPNP
jgi:hypothetical protein